jgi:hypothetical protein
LAPNNLWLFVKLESAVTGRKFQDTEDIQKKSDDGTESCSTSGISKMFPAVAALLG